MKKTFLTSLLLLTIFFAIGSAITSAQTGGSGTTGGTGGTGNTNNPRLAVTLENPFKNTGSNSLFDLLKAVINNILLPIGGVIAVLSFIYSGFLYVMAQGNETKLSTAHKALLYTSIGTAVLLGSWVLANVICNTIGLLGGPVCVSMGP